MRTHRGTSVHWYALPGALIAGASFGQVAPDDAQVLIQEIIDSVGHYVAPVGDCPPIIPGEPSAIGQWELVPFKTNTGVVHGAVLPTGKVIWWAGELVAGPFVSGVWDPATNEMATQEMLGIDQFCAYQVFMADGYLMTIGGGGNAAPGFKDCLVFDHDLETWSKLDSMEFGRWYPTSVVLGDGKIATFSGYNGPVEEVEVYDPEIDQWSTLPDSADKYLEIYPSMHLMPDGTLFYTGTRWNGGAGWGGATTALLDLETNSWSNVGNHVIGDRSEGVSVLIPEKEAGAEPWRVLVAGGYANGNQQDSAEIIDMSQQGAAWQQITDMNFPRNNANGVILPDGNVVFCTGIEGFKWNGDRIDTLDAEMFDPDTNTWTVMDAMQYPGQYHSISLLLPDGRVVKTGGQDGGPVVYEIEVYSPPYLFRGPRPEITSAPDTIGWGSQIKIDTTQADSIQSVSLVRMSTITHHTNTDQRYLSLALNQQDADTVVATAPAHGNLAPPGLYYLSVVNDCGVPSESKIVIIGPAGECYPDYNDDGSLDILDFIAFQNGWTANEPAADCDGDGAFNILDFVCFQNAFKGGCP